MEFKQLACRITHRIPVTLGLAYRLPSPSLPYRIALSDTDKDSDRDMDIYIDIYTDILSYIFNDSVKHPYPPDRCVLAYLFTGLLSGQISTGSVPIAS
jgi:hypothetical protein